MAVLVGSARHDEYGRSGWQGTAKAGDQTGREVSTQAWYKHNKGWVVLRPKDPAKAEKIAQNMEFACRNEKIGYDQSERSTLYDAAKPFGFNCSMVKKACETDCSALVRVCCLYAGIDVPNFRTANEAQILMATGQFIELTANRFTATSKWLKRGDIMVTRSVGHTVVVLSDGSEVKKEEDEYMFSVKVVQKGCTGASVLLCQELLRVKGYKGKDGKVLSLDGDAGENTIYAINSFQSAMRKKGIECGTNGHNDSSCGQRCWKALLGL